MKLKEITPSEFICGGGGCGGCPAVFETETSYVIIGKKLSASAQQELNGRISDDEFAIEVQKGMIDGIR